MLLGLLKNFGEKMALIKTQKDAAVLVLVDRVEKEGPFFSMPSDPRAYPIVRFERPPELCGIDEPADSKILFAFKNDLRQKFLSSLIQTAKGNRVSTIYCAETGDLKAEPYRAKLSQANIRLEEYTPK